MKIIFSLLVFCFTNHLNAQLSLPSQVKKGKWMISHDIFSVGFETQTSKQYINDVYVGKEKFSDFHMGLAFQSPYWGGVFASSGKSNTYDANGTELGGYKRKSFVFTLQPSVGRFISDRLLLGAELNLYFSKDKSDYFTPNDSEENTLRYITLGIGPHIRYYFGPMKSKQLFHVGLSGGVNYTTMKQESSDNGDPPTVYKTKQPNYYAKPYIGSSWFVGKHWTFGASLAYRYETTRYKLNSANSSSRTNSTLSDITLDGSVSFTF